MIPPEPRRCALHRSVKCPANCTSLYQPCTDGPPQDEGMHSGPPMWLPLSIIALAMVIAFALGLLICRI